MDQESGNPQADEIAARLGELIATSRATPPAATPPAGTGRPPVAPERPADDSSKHILLGPALATPDRFQSRLGRMLIDRDLITAEELDRALLRQTTTGERLGEALVGLGAVASVDVTRVLAEHLRLPFVDLRDDASDSTVAGVIPAEVARRFVALPVARWGDRVVMAMANPNDTDMVEELRLLVNAPIVAAVADPVELRRMIASVYGDTAVPPSEDPAVFTCPGCQQQLTVRTAPWVMMELNRDPGRYYVWEHEPGTAGPAHVCRAPAAVAHLEPAPLAARRPGA